MSTVELLVHLHWLVYRDLARPRKADVVHGVCVATVTSSQANVTLSAE
jgi:hypothetical protein